MGDNIKLDGKVAIVTGAGRGMGRAMALALAEAGARVVAADLSAENLERVEREAAALSGGGALAGVVTDIRKSQDCRRAIDTACERFGGLDILVNNAGLLQKAGGDRGGPSADDGSRQDARPDRVARLARGGLDQRHALRRAQLGCHPAAGGTGGTAWTAARL